MSELQELYGEMIRDHNNRPRNFRALAARTHEARGHNPLCGDEIDVHVQVDARENIVDLAFQGQGCAISKASASMMTEALKGKNMQQARELFARFHDVVAGEAGGAAPAPGVEIGKLQVFSGVRAFPMRVKCATLCWHALRAALAGAREKATTE